MKNAGTRGLKFLLLSTFLVSIFDVSYGMYERRASASLSQGSDTCIILYRNRNWDNAVQFYDDGRLAGTVEQTIKKRMSLSLKGNINISFFPVESRINTLDVSNSTNFIGAARDLAQFIESLSMQGFKRIHVFTFGPGVIISAMASQLFNFREEDMAADPFEVSTLTRMDLAFRADQVPGRATVAGVSEECRSYKPLVSKIANKSGRRASVFTHGTSEALAELTDIDSRLENSGRQELVGKDVKVGSPAQSQIEIGASPMRRDSISMEASRRRSSIQAAYDGSAPAAQSQTSRNESRMPSAQTENIDSDPEVALPGFLGVAIEGMCGIFARTKALFVDGRRSRGPLVDKPMVMVHIFGEMPSFPITVDFDLDAVIVQHYQIDAVEATGCWCCDCDDETQDSFKLCAKAAIGMAIKFAIVAISAAL